MWIFVPIIARKVSALLTNAAILPVIVAHTAQAQGVDFGRDIRPLLSDRCFKCHGPDGGTREADLRLDQRESALDVGAIVPGAPEASSLVERIFSEQAEKRMPPPESNLSLSDAERALLKQWIAEGAVYEQHWAFRPIAHPAPPAVDDASEWARSGIDQFVLARLEAEGLAPSPMTDKERLLRRVTLHLTGLPPTLAEIDAFLADEAPGAYVRVVDGLLQRTTFGERMATDWLDVARFADTFGYQSDRESRMWPYRDWVIEAFNKNLPYDDFITWQIAGDLLPGATQKQTLATAFNRLHRQTNEGGSVLEEWRVEYVADRVHTYGTAFLGMTMECARCHDHKFDPISQREYYSLFAFFDDIDESGMYSHFTDPTPTPNLALYEDGQRAKHDALIASIVRKESALDNAVKRALDDFADWTGWQSDSFPSFKPLVHLALDELTDGTTPDEIRPDAPAGTGRNPELIDGVDGGAFLFSGESEVTVKGAASFERTDPFTVALWLRMAAVSERQVVLHRSKAAEDAASRGYELLLIDGRPEVALVHFWPGNAIRIAARDALPSGEWTHIAFTYDGSSRADGLALYVNGFPVEVDVMRDNLYGTIRYDGGSDKDTALTLAARFRDAGFKGGAIDDVRVYDRDLSAMEVALLEDGRDLEKAIPFRAGFVAAHDLADDAMREYVATRMAPAVLEARETAHEARVEEHTFSESLRRIMVMNDMAEPRTAYLLARGDYAQRTDPVAPDTPESILSFDGYPNNRLGLAQWTVSEDNPLTARVAVNRIWKLLFGTGLVETLEDFGNQGRPPSHPKLLDYLASEFVASGWDVKALVKRIVASSVYMQSSAPRKDLATADPTNRLLARGPRHRMSAEAIRDSALAASGLLVSKLGGPSVKPYQPEGLWRDASSVTYKRDEGDGLYRRSMYTFWKRTVPPPSMMTFDATSREVCVAQREVTSTPLQTLILMNDAQYVEAARVLAAELLSVASVDDCIAQAFRRLVTRTPDSTERRILRAAYDEQFEYFKGHPDEAVEYLAVGDMPAPENANRAELAALTAVCQAVMNIDEFQVIQ